VRTSSAEFRGIACQQMYSC